MTQKTESDELQTRNEREQSQQQQQDASEVHKLLDNIAVQADAGNVQGVKDLAERVRGKVAGHFPKPVPGSKSQHGAQQQQQGSKK
jgi:hypothetical protein